MSLPYDSCFPFPYRKCRTFRLKLFTHLLGKKINNTESRPNQKKTTTPTEKLYRPKDKSYLFPCNNDNFPGLSVDKTEREKKKFYTVRQHFLRKLQKQSLKFIKLRLIPKPINGASFSVSCCSVGMSKVYCAPLLMRLTKHLSD
jgi:hypothetical protein